MPTYEYLCASCGKRYDKREGFDAPARQKCQNCGKATAQRVLHAPPVVFKGSGFYKTDSRGSSSSSSDAAASAPDASTSNDGAGDAAKPAGDAKIPSTKDAPKKDTTPTQTAAAG